MSGYFDKSAPMTEGVWRTTRYCYPPPQDIDQYVSRALPPPPTRPRSYSSSIYDLEKAHSRQQTPEHLLGAHGLKNDRRPSTISGGIDEDVSAMVELPEIIIPEDSESYEKPLLVSPRPQRPDSRLLSMWANGDELVSPIRMPAEGSWANHAVSPLSEGQAPIEYESWFDDTSSDEGSGPDSSTWAQDEIQFPDHVLSEASYTQIERTVLRYSDPGSPLSPRLNWDFGEPGPDVGGFDDASGRQTAQPQTYALSPYRSDGQSHPRDNDASIGEPKVTFAVHNIDTFSSNRPRATQRRMPPPLQLGEQSAVQEEYVKTPFPPRSSSISPQKSSSRAGDSSTQMQKRSGLGGFSSLRRRSAQNISQPPPGFTEILSQMDYQGTVSPVPRVKNILSKAKHGLAIVRTASKKEKGRDESGQMHLDAE